ncbi:NTP transferase domain-containing protein [Helicobacter vulpis]|uniref:NTP transferase domain-containing protein n=1 Tax=Helicobacter vulpis TaxID=2316076 RepID=UPI000EB48EBA|nr:NTP transferase domain-containing protein [Helicobacter vulpis]
MIKIPCVILTGGKSARMRVGEQWRDKALLRFGDQPSLLAYQHAKMARLFEQVYISAKTPYDLQAAYILDASPHCFNPLLGIGRALKELQQRIFVIPIDMPLVSAQSILALCEHSQKAGVVYAKSARHFYLLGCWQPCVLDAIDDALQSNASIYALLEQVDSVAIEVTDSSEFSNCNTYADYQHALRSLHG